MTATPAKKVQTRQTKAPAKKAPAKKAPAKKAGPPRASQGKGHSADYRELRDIPIAMGTVSSGRLTLREELAMPFLKETCDALAESGFGWILDARDEFRLPDEVFEQATRRPEFIAAVGGMEQLVGISLFLGGAISSWAIGKVCDAIAGKVAPALRKLFRTRDRRRGGTSREAITLSFQAWFDVDQVLIQVIAHLHSGEPADSVDLLVSEAFSRGYEWIQQHGIQQPVLTYHISRGDLSSVPTLSRDTYRQQ